MYLEGWRENPWERGAKQGKPAKRKGKQIGKDGKWGELGPAPPGHCHGCHKRGHS